MRGSGVGAQQYGAIDITTRRQGDGLLQGIQDSGVGDVNALAGGIGKALVCAAAGMIVAIPALLFHRYFRGRVTGYVMEMEKEATALVDALEARHPRPVVRPSGAAAAAPAPTSA